MSARDNYAMSLSPPPPSDIGTYSRSMLQHTKRQMEAVNGSGAPASNSGSRTHGGGHMQSQNAAVGPPALPNGVGARSRNPSEYSYQT